MRVVRFMGIIQELTHFSVIKTGFRCYTRNVKKNFTNRKTHYLIVDFTINYISLKNKRWYNDDTDFT